MPSASADVKSRLERSLLAVNGGSCSLKFAVFSFERRPRRLLSGEFKRIGLRGTLLELEDSRRGLKQKLPLKARRPEDCIPFLTRILDSGRECPPLAVIGHRIVHGGARHFKATIATTALLKELDRLCLFDPEHLPSQLSILKALRRKYPGVPQVACFDTGFHERLPKIAQLLAIPRRYFGRGVRRYGFHGLSYSYLMQELARQAGTKAAKGRVILAHLGNGASLTAVKGGKPIDTTMAFTPAAGLVMGTRSGDLDPGLPAYFARTEKMNAHAFNRMINSESGLLGVSGTTSDMEDLLRLEKRDPRAAEALSLFCYQAKKAIGAFAAALGGLDTLVFSGGIGEHSSVIRQRICAGLSHLGLQLDSNQNKAPSRIISSRSSRVSVRVIPTDEESEIARMTFNLLKK